MSRSTLTGLSRAIGTAGVFAAATLAQAVTPLAVPGAPSPGNSNWTNATDLQRAPAIYRLQIESSYTSLAVACDIPDVFSEALRGTLTLQRVPVSDPSGDLIARFRVSDVNLLLDAPFDAERITGSGVYEVYRSVGPLDVVAERLSLELRFGGNAPVRFDSGFVPADGDPRSFDLDVTEVSLVPFPCVSRTLRIAADITPQNEFIAYRLGDAAFYSFQISPLGPVQFFPMSGRFALVELPDDPNASTSIEWGVVRIGWRYFENDISPGVPSATFVRGVGIYQVARQASGHFPEHRLLAGLTRSGPSITPAPAASNTQGFDSGWVPNPAPGSNPPFLSIQIFDTNPNFPIESFNVVAGPVLILSR